MMKVRRSWRYRLSILASCLVTATWPARGGEVLTATDGDWPQWRGPDRDGKSAETGLLKSWPEGGPALLWKADGAGVGYAGMSTSKGRLFTMGSREGEEFIIALDVLTGKELWRVPSGKGFRSDRGGGPRGTPTVSGDVLYALGALGDLACLSATDGKKLWHVNVLEKFNGKPGKWGMAESVLVEGEKVICSAGGPDATVVALDRKTGETIWTSKGLGDRAAYASGLAITACGVRQIVNFSHSAAVGVSAQDGTLLWRYPRVANGVANCATPLFHGNHIFFTSDYDTGCVLLDLKEEGGKPAAKEVYFNTDLQNHHGGVILLDGRIYGHSGGNDASSHAFVCMDFLTGKVVWTDPGIGKCSIIYAEGHLYALTQDGIMGLVKASPEKFLLKSRFTFKKYKGRFRTSNLMGEDAEKPTWTHPIISGKKLFLRDGDAIFCYDIAAR